MPNFIDPFGLKIVCDCSCRSYLEENGVKNFMTINSSGNLLVYQNNYGLTYTAGDLTSEILYRMVKYSLRTFKVKNGDVNELKKHVHARLGVIFSATSAQWVFHPWANTLNSDHWNPDFTIKPTSNAKAAIDDLWSHPDQYKLGCWASTVVVFLQGVSSLYTTQDFNLLVGSDPENTFSIFQAIHQGIQPNQGWVPGDWGYIKNNSQTPNLGYEGENIIDIGSGKYWGMISTTEGGQIKSLQEWINSVALWNGSAGATDAGIRRFPKAGLE